MMKLLSFLTGSKPKAPPSDGAFSFSNVDIISQLSIHDRRCVRRKYEKRFSHAPHIRAELVELKAKAKQPHVDNVELLEAHFLWELDTFRRPDIHKHKLMWRFIRRNDPGLHRYLTGIIGDEKKKIVANGDWHDIMERCHDEYRRRQAFGYRWPERCEPFYHCCMPDAMTGMRALGKALLSADVKTSFDLEPTLTATADADKGGDQGGSGSGSMANVPKRTFSEEEELPAVLFVPVEQIEAMEGPKPPWVP